MRFRALMQVLLLSRYNFLSHFEISWQYSRKITSSQCEI
jgi:hypothetical protein